METKIHLDWCNSAITMSGATYVMVNGQILQLVWFAGLLDIYLKVSTCISLVPSPPLEVGEGLVTFL